jgi:AraC-like DNA-binding protein
MRAIWTRGRPEAGFAEQSVAVVSHEQIGARDAGAQDEVTAVVHIQRPPPHDDWVWLCIDVPPTARYSACRFQRSFRTVYDLLGALFTGSDPAPFSSHTDKLFTRVRRIIKNRFTDPDIGPCEVAAEARISLRYLQKLFTSRGATCSHYIQSLRLDYAAQLVRRRASLKTFQPLSEIAYTCGFGDYTHFARAFRRRFGHPPGAQPEQET